jgi:Sulfotransferase family
VISHRYKCIFIHIPKTAGTSIEQKLGHFEILDRGVQDHRTISEIEPITLSDLAKSCFHLNPKAFILQIKKLIKDKQLNFKQCYDTYFKFSFVRNPWARTFSWYRNVMRDNHHKKRFGIADDCLFKDFLAKHLNQGELKPQLLWLTNKKGDIPFDFIGRFENLKDDFDYVAEKIGLENKELPKLIAGDGQRYTSFYDSKMVDLIYKQYKDEIDYFNFKYGE